MAKSEKNSGSGSGPSSPPTPPSTSTTENPPEVAYVAKGMEMTTKRGLLFGGEEVRPMDFNGGRKVFDYYLKPEIGCLVKDKPKG